MEFQLLPIFTFLSLAVVASHEALSPEAYWISVLPSTPMPQAIKDLVRAGSVNIVDAWKGNPGVGSDARQKYGKRYYYADDELHHNSKVALFFLEKDMRPGAKMTLNFTKSTNTATFLPRQLAQKIPFSSNRLLEILNHFSVKPNSKEAEIMKKTIKECEEPGIKGEEKCCATSLESMVDFSTSNLGKNVGAISTEVEDGIQLQNYSIARVKKMASDKAVVCHKQNYAYAVFYCHKILHTETYMASIVGADGTNAKAVAVCHRDTSAWNPKYLAFQMLKVKPGTVPICHFLPQDTPVWFSN